MLFSIEFFSAERTIERYKLQTGNGKRAKGIEKNVQVIHHLSLKPLLQSVLLLSLRTYWATEKSWIHEQFNMNRATGAAKLSMHEEMLCWKICIWTSTLFSLSLYAVWILQTVLYCSIGEPKPLILQTKLRPLNLTTGTYLYKLLFACTLLNFITRSIKRKCFKWKFLHSLNLSWLQKTLGPRIRRMFSWWAAFIRGSDCKKLTGN